MSKELNKISAVNVIIVITIIMYLIQENIAYGSLYLGLNMHFVASDFWWQPLSSVFAHGGIAHLGMNMFVLYQFGGLVEKYKGAKNFLILYFFCGILTSLLSFSYIYFLDNTINMVGASGAICAILGYVAYLDKSQRSGIITWILLISVAPLLIGLPIAWYAHFIGLAVGFIYGIVRK